MSERRVQARPWRLADWINPTGVKKVHSLIDKVYRQENLETTWERVKENGGGGGVDRQRVTGLLDRWIPQPRDLHPYPDKHFQAIYPR